MIKSWIRNPDTFFHKLPEGIVIFSHSASYFKGNEGFKILWEALVSPVSHSSLINLPVFEILVAEKLIIESFESGATFTATSEISLKLEDEAEREIEVFAGVGDGFPPSDY